MEKKTKFGMADAIILTNIELKNKIVNFLFNSIDLSLYRYNILTNIQKLQFLKENEHYVAPNFLGYNYLLLFLTIDGVRYSVAVDKKGLSYHKNQINIKSINIFKILVNASEAIFRGSIFDCKLLNIGDRKAYKYSMLINDCYFLMGNKLLDVDMIQKINHINSIIKNHFHSCKNFDFKINKLTEYKNLKNLIENIIPSCTIKCQGLIFFPKYSGINILFISKKGQSKIDIDSNNSNQEISNKSYDLIVNLTDYLKCRNYSYETNGKNKKLWLKNTEIPDVYNVFEDIDDAKLGIAHIPNIKISHMCTDLIKEDPVRFICTYSNSFKKWIPVKSC